MRKKKISGKENWEQLKKKKRKEKRERKVAKKVGNVLIAEAAKGFQKWFESPSNHDDDRQEKQRRTQWTEANDYNENSHIMDWGDDDDDDDGDDTNDDDEEVWQWAS